MQLQTNCHPQHLSWPNQLFYTASRRSSTNSNSCVTSLLTLIIPLSIFTGKGFSSCNLYGLSISPVLIKTV